MPLADFLANIGRGTLIGRGAEAFGGRTTRQQNLDAFINDELPKLADALDKAQTRQEVENAGRQLSMSWLKAGLPSNEQFDKFAERLTGPAINRVQQGDLESIRRDYGPQTTPLTPQVAPEGQGQPLGLDTAFAPQTTPARPLDLQGAARYFEATGAKPQSFESIFRTPSAIAENEAQAGAANALKSNRMSEQAVQDIQTHALEGLPETDIPGTGMTTRSLGQATKGGGLSSLVREQDPLVEERRRLLGAQTGAAGAQAEAARARGAAAGREGRGSADMQDFIRQGGDPADQEGFLNYVNRRRSITTETETPIGGEQSAIDEAVIAKKAIDRGKTDSASIKAIANELGYQIEGNPTVEAPTISTQLFGLQTRRDPQGRPVQETPARLKGDFTLRRKPKTVTRGVPGGQAPQAQPAEGGKQLDEATAGAILKEAGGDKAKAREIAKARGFRF